MSRLSRNIVTIYRTERLIARRRFAVVQHQTLLMGLAALAGLAGLVSLNVAVFLTLTSWLSPAASAAVLACGNLILAGCLVLVARATNVEREIAPAVEVRDMAIADIEDELEDMASEAREVVQAVKSFGANPLGSLPALLVPLLSAIIKSRSGK